MPHVTVKMYAGRSDEQKAAIAEAITKALMATANCSEPSISVSIRDIAAEDWVETVYKPEIVDRPDEVFKQPGYNPL